MNFPSLYKRPATFQQTRGRYRQMGGTLVEAVVSLFVFSIGALGIAALQTTSFMRVDDIKQRSIAVWKAQELVDRMRATKTSQDPNGLLPEYFALINNTDADGGIGKFDASDDYSLRCAAPAKRCDDTSGSAATACSTQEYVQFDLWSVMCDPTSGVAVTTGFSSGTVGLRNLELAMEQSGTGYKVYFEWLSRSADNDTQIRGGGNIKALLCGEEKLLDPRLDAYCIWVE